MDAVLKVVGTIGAIWLAVSILLAAAWALGGRRIFRKPPTPPKFIDGEEGDASLTWRPVSRIDRGPNVGA